MKLFGGSDLVNEQNQKIRQLLGEGTGGMRAASAQTTNSNWRDIARQNIQDIAGSSKPGSRNLTYLDRFKEGLENGKFKARTAPTGSNNLERVSRSKSNNRSSSFSKRIEPKSTLDINTKQLNSAKRRFSQNRKEERPKSAQPPAESLKVSQTGENFLKGSKINSIIDSIQKLRTNNIGSTASVLDGLIQRQQSERLIGSATKNKDVSRDYNDRLLKTPAPWPKDIQTKSNVKTDLKALMEQLEKKKPEVLSPNFLTPKARLVFNNRREGFIGKTEDKGS